MSYKTGLSVAAALGAASILGAFSGGSWAAEQKAFIEEVVVTARKQEESVQDVPIAITALTQELENSSIRNLSDLDGYAPNLIFGTNGGRGGGGADINIRGISPTRSDDNSFDAVTVAFGVRNFENLELGLSELFRVLKPGGTLVVLETAVPSSFPFKQGYKFHTQVIIPLMGKLFTRDQAAYKYLSDSAAVFPYGKQFNNILEKIGFIEVEDKPQTLGVASIYCATKP